MSRAHRVAGDLRIGSRRSVVLSRGLPRCLDVGVAGVRSSGGPHRARCRPFVLDEFDGSRAPEPVPVASRTTSSEHFRSLYRQHYGLVWSAARRFGIERDAIEDVVQEAFLVAYRRMDRFQGGSVGSWLYGSTRRVASSHRRSAYRAARRNEVVGRALPEAPKASADALETWPLSPWQASSGPRRSTSVLAGQPDEPRRRTHPHRVPLNGLTKTSHTKGTPLRRPGFRLRIRSRRTRRIPPR